MSEGCCGSSGETLLFACAGAAHCGQVTNRAALQLTIDGVAQIFCTAAVSAGVEDKLDRTRRAWRRVAIDGCEDHCVRKTLETADLPVDLHFVAMDLGVEKQPANPRMLEDARNLADQIQRVLLAASARA